MGDSARATVWPPLPLDGWRETYDTFHMWTQVVGKICLALTPLTNHYWNIAFRVTPCGLATPVMFTDGRTLAMTFNVVEHRLEIRVSDGARDDIPLRPMSVADFYGSVISALTRLGIDVRIWTMPVEFATPIPFEKDVVHHAYDAPAVTAFWRALVCMLPVFERFRSGFVGKCSPVHFFWGSFDLAVTRFSGRRSPERTGADAMTRESYSHEVISHGFWPGSGAVQEPAFYAYAAPEPPGLRNAHVQPAAAFYSTDFSEFILPYEAVRTAGSPEDALLAFMQTTYASAADLAGWDRSELERRHA